jgi:hypothetical protein
LLWVCADGIGWAIARVCWAIEVIASSKKVDIGKLDEAGVAVATAAKARVDCGCVADALVMGEFQALIGWFANNGVQSVEHESGFDVIEARSLGGCHGEY